MALPRRRADFILARSFDNPDDLNRQLRVWLDTVANAHLHGSIGHVVAEHLTAERACLVALPAVRFADAPRTPSGASAQVTVSVGGNALQRARP